MSVFAVVSSVMSETLWTVVCDARLSLGCFRQEYWRGLPMSSSRDSPDTGILPALAGKFSNASATWEAHVFASDTKINTQE